MTSILSQIQTRNVITDDESFKSVFADTYREEPVVFDVDPLVLSVRLKKMKAADPHGWHRIESPQVKAQLDGEDWNDAIKIKDYYSKKLVWNSLSDEKLSNYRASLLQLLHHPKHNLSKKEVGMIVTLPHFYEEDQTLDSIVKSYRVADTPRITPNLGRFARNLTLIGTTNRWLNKTHFNFYWFADDNKFVYSIQLAKDNVLLPFFEDAIMSNEPSFDTLLTKVDYPFSYYKMYDFKLLKKEQNA